MAAARSTDGGRTFSAPAQVSDPERELVGAASPVVDADGNLAVLYQDFGRDTRDYPQPRGARVGGALLPRRERVPQGGRTFSKGVEVDDGLVPTKRFLVFLPEFPSLAAGGDGSLYASWSDGRHGDPDVFLRRSTDGGRTWGDAVRVNDNRRRDGTSQYLPRVSVAPGGRVDVLFLDRRRDPSAVMTDAYLASSHDDGRSFDNVRVSSSPFDSRVGFSANPQAEPDFGSRLGLVSADDHALAVWTDTRLGTEDTARQDLAAAPVRVSWTAPALAGLPVIAVLLTLAALCLGRWWAGERRRPAADEGDEQGERPRETVDAGGVKP